MPHILEAQFPERTPSGAPGGTSQQIATSPAMFGGLEAQALGQGAASLERLGAGLERAGATGMQVATERQNLVNQVHAADVNAWFGDRVSEEWAKFSSLEGRAAMDARPAFNDRLEQLWTEAIGRAGSETERAALATSLRGQQSRYFGYAASHAARQERTYAKGVAQSSALGYGNQAGIAFSQDDIKSFEDNLQKQDNEWRNYYEAFGFEPQAIEAEVTKNRGKTLQQIIESTAKAGGPDGGPDVQRAAALYARYKDQMDAGSRLHVDGVLKPLLQTAKASLMVDFAMERPPAGEHFSDAERAGNLPRGYVSRLFQIESGGNPDAVTGSNRGLGQFSPDLERKYGITDANRRDPIAQTRAVLAEAAEHRPVLAKALGREPRPSELYLAHQQGLGGAIAHLTNPTRPAWQSMLSTGEGKAKGEAWAKAAIWGNMTPAMKERFPGGVDTVTSGDFVAMWSARFGGGSDMNRPLPDRQVALDRVISMTDGDPDLQARAVNELNRRYSAVQQQTTQARAALDQRVKDTTAEALDKGAAQNPLTDAEFTQVYGPEEGAKRYGEYAATLQLGADVASLATLSPGETADLVKRYDPQTGPGFAAAEKRRDALVRAQQHLAKERDADPAAYALRRLPAVSAANAELAKALSDPNADPAAKQAAAARLAEVTLAEQARIGVPADERRVVPKAYVDQLAAKLSAPVEAGGGLAVVNAIQAEAALWGDRWPSIYKDLAKSAQSLVRVIGSGVQPQAARVLAEVGDVNLTDILKDQDTEKPAHIKKDVLTAFKPFAATMTGLEGWVPVFNDFRGQAEKLAAYYVAKGTDSSTAAQKAFDELIGFKYEFGDTYRIPKTVGNVDQIKAGLAAAKATLGALPATVPPPVPTTGVIERGNIDLAKRPVVNNADGTVSTVRSMSANIDGVEVLIPTVTDDGRVVSDEEAIALYERTGRHLGKFATPADATTYAEALHRQQEENSRNRIAVKLGDIQLPTGGMGVSDAYRKTAAAKAYARDGAWITSPDETGVMLAYKDEVVRMRDGKPLFLSWQDLTDLVAQRVAREEQAGAALRGSYVSRFPMVP